MLRTPRFDVRRVGVHLEWLGVGTIGAAVVERRSPADGWVAIGPARPEPIDRFVFDDRDVHAGERWAYRLAYRTASGSGHTEPAWADVPGVAPMFRALGSQPFRGDAIRFEIVTRAAGGGRLELFDLAGRRAAAASFTVAESGPAVVAVPVAGLANGVYFARVRGNRN